MQICLVKNWKILNELNNCYLVTLKIVWQEGQVSKGKKYQFYYKFVVCFDRDSIE